LRPISRASTRLIACTSTFACYAAVRIPVVVSGPGRHAAGLRRCGILRGLGLTIGLMGAAALATMIKGFLFEVQPNDVVVYATVAVTLVAAGLLAAWLPARRAAMVDPLISIRKL
jgi:ABC-type lipoprotein release transport system permease subunit